MFFLYFCTRHFALADDNCETSNNNLTLDDDEKTYVSCSPGTVHDGRLRTKQSENHHHSTEDWSQHLHRRRFGWKAGCALGFELQHQINRKTAIAGALLYSFQGGKDDDWTWNPGYINIPITLNYYVAKNFALKAGIQPGFMVNKDDARHVNTFDFAIPVGMSYEFDNFVIDGRYNIGVTKVPKHGDGYTNVVQLTLGYKFKL